MDPMTYLALGVRVGQAAMNLIQAAMSGNEEEAKKALAAMRDVWQRGSDDLDAALKARNG